VEFGKVKFTTMSCACCSGLSLTYCAIVLMSTYYSYLAGGYFVFSGSERRGAPGQLGRRLAGIFFFILSLLLALLCGSAIVPQTRAYTFARMCEKLSSSPPMDAVRCGSSHMGLSNINGEVLEFGPGAAPNFGCWGPAGLATYRTTPRIPLLRPGVTKWLGIEPNPNFQSSVATSAARHKIPFSTQTAWLRGESGEMQELEADPASFDHVVWTHVLCSAGGRVGTTYITSLHFSSLHFSFLHFSALGV
jgi:hypothetical protein